MVDFTKLRARTPAEQAEDQARWEAEAVARDAAERQAKIKHTRTITLVYDSEAGFTTSGERHIHLRGTDESNRPLRASYVTPHSMSRADADALAESLKAGTSATLAGYFRPHQDRSGQTQFTLMAMTLENAHTRDVAQGAWDRTRTARQSGEDAGTRAASHAEQAAWDAARPARQAVEDRDAAVMKEARDFADLVRNHRDETLLLSAERRGFADRYAALHEQGAAVLGGLAAQVPPSFEGLPHATLTDPRNAFLVIDLDAKRNARNPLDRELQIREMGYLRMGEDLYAENRTDARVGPLPVHPLSLRTEMPDDRDQILWDDLRRNADQARATPRGAPRDFLVLPLAGPVAEHPSMRQAASFARSIQADGGEVLNRLDATSTKLRGINANLDRLTDQVLDTAWRIANAEGRPPYDDARTAAVQGLDWQRTADRYADPLTARRPVAGVEAASAALNSQPLANAVLTYVAAKGRENWAQLLDLPQLHGDLLRSNTPAPTPRIEVRGTRDLGDARRPDLTTSDLFEATKRGERTALTMGGFPGTPSGFDALKPGDMIRLHRGKRGEPAQGHLDLMVTGPVRRVDRHGEPETFETLSRAQGITPEALAQQAAQRGLVVHLPVRVVATDAVQRPHWSAALRREAGAER